MQSHAYIVSVVLVRMYVLWQLGTRAAACQPVQHHAVSAPGLYSFLLNGT